MGVVHCVRVFSKPGSVSLTRRQSFIYYCSRLQSLATQPGRSTGRVIPPLFGLAANGVYLASLLPDCWCALTEPLHPYRINPAVFISVALALRSPSAVISRHPALCSPDFPLEAPMSSSDHLSYSRAYIITYYVKFVLCFFSLHPAEACRFRYCIPRMGC